MISTVCGSTRIIKHLIFYRTLVCGSHVYREEIKLYLLRFRVWTCCREAVSFREQRQMFHLQLWRRLELRSAGNPRSSVLKGA
jgi:hypothetical protein